MEQTLSRAFKTFDCQSPLSANMNLALVKRQLRSQIDWLHDTLRHDERSASLQSHRKRTNEDLLTRAVLVMQEVERKFESIGNAELVINLPQVVLDDLFGGTELIGNLLIAHALRDAGDDR